MKEIIIGLIVILIIGFFVVSKNKEEKPTVVEVAPVETKGVGDKTLISKGITIKTFEYLGGGIGSLLWGGKEFVDNIPGNSDHGRQLQSAIQVNEVGEANNPTECGSDHLIDGYIPAPSSSRTIGAKVEANVLMTTTQMAYFKRYQGKVLSDYVMDKRVEILDENRIRYDVAFHIPEDTNNLQIEALTGYIPNEFKEFYGVLPNGSLIDLDSQKGEQQYPIIIANSEGTHAMGVKAITDNPRGYGLFSFEKEKVRKWNVVWRVRSPEMTTYRYSMIVYVGSLETVRKLMK